MTPPESFIARATWRSTNLLSPHQYTVRDWNDSSEFSMFVKLIRENPRSWDRKFLGRSLRSLMIGEFYYWTMGFPVEEATVINRAKPEWLWRTDVFPDLPPAEERRPRGMPAPSQEEMDASE